MSSVTQKLGVASESTIHIPGSGRRQLAVVHKRSPRRVSRGMALCLFGVAVMSAACGANGAESPGFASGNGPLADICPRNVVIQTDWNPQAEHGFLYNLFGDGYEIDEKNVAVKGPLWSRGVDTGVGLEIRSGGPAISFSPVVAELYAKPEILLGFVSTDTQVRQAIDFPTMAVVAPFNINPQIIMWDPATYPDVKTISDLKTKGVKVRTFQGVSYVKYLLGKGLLEESQIDSTYDGMPASFLAAGGKDAQQGFGTSEPFFYQYVLREWGRPIAYQYIHDAGWNTYSQALAGTPDAVAANEECLSELVPVIQRSLADFLRSPERATSVIIDAVQKFKNGWTYTEEQATASVEKQLEDGLVANSPDGTLGSFDLVRVNDFISKATPIYLAEGENVKNGLVAEDLVTNAFIDPGVSLGG